ncbi:SagB/ThcOx family dehydrogenase [Longirhabdus pacifica]|uniref:SagB/ThcOx family dehydrogenase n=1 Tax=Longirhabdus pacifica TaxID=2305227 RepID=UPI001008ACDE|nr:SagB/ThcOx family dehydrogenase [Longirhabdus pacifica]
MPIIHDKRKIDGYLYPKHESIGLQFYYDSRFIPLISNEDMARINLYLNQNFVEKNAGNFKAYDVTDNVFLTPSFEEVDMKLNKAILTRRTKRNFQNVMLSKEEISNLICLTYGIHQQRYIHFDKPDGTEVKHYMRTVPSPGALYPLELYVVINNVQDIPKGLYHYHIMDKKLELLKSGDMTEDLNKIYDERSEQINNASAVIITTGIFERVIEKYGERGWRFLFLEAGHLNQNMALVSTALNIGIHHIGGGYDNLISEFLGIDGIQEGPLYTAYIGK